MHAWSPSKRISRACLFAQGWRYSYVTKGDHPLSIKTKNPMHRPKKVGFFSTLALPLVRALTHTMAPPWALFSGGPRHWHSWRKRVGPPPFTNLGSGNVRALPFSRPRALPSSYEILPRVLALRKFPALVGPRQRFFSRFVCLRGG